MKRLLYTFLPIIALCLFNACSDQNKEDLQGEWELISKPNDNFEYKWSFRGTKVVIESTDNDEPFDGSFDTCAMGNYFLKNGVLTIATSTSFCNYSFFAGDWDVQKLDKKVLALRLNATDQNSGTIWYEFEKIVD